MSKWMLKQIEKSVRSEFQFLVVISMNNNLYAHSDNNHDFFFYLYSRWSYYLVKRVERTKNPVNLDLDTHGYLLTYLRVEHTIIQIKTSGAHANNCFYNTSEWVSEWVIVV